MARTRQSKELLSLHDRCHYHRARDLYEFADLHGSSPTTPAPLNQLLTALVRKGAPLLQKRANIERQGRSLSAEDSLKLDLAIRATEVLRKPGAQAEYDQIAQRRNRNVTGKAMLALHDRVQGSGARDVYDFAHLEEYSPTAPAPLDQLLTALQEKRAVFEREGVPCTQRGVPELTAWACEALGEPGAQAVYDRIAQGRNVFLHPAHAPRPGRMAQPEAVERTAPRRGVTPPPARPKPVEAYRRSQATASQSRGSQSRSV